MDVTNTSGKAREPSRSTHTTNSDQTATTVVDLTQRADTRTTGNSATRLRHLVAAATTSMGNNNPANGGAANKREKQKKTKRVTLVNGEKRTSSGGGGGSKKAACSTQEKDSPRRRKETLKRKTANTVKYFSVAFSRLSVLLHRSKFQCITHLVELKDRIRDPDQPRGNDISLLFAQIIRQMDEINIHFFERKVSYLREISLEMLKCTSFELFKDYVLSANAAVKDATLRYKLSAEYIFAMNNYVNKLYSKSPMKRHPSDLTSMQANTKSIKEIGNEFTKIQKIFNNLLVDFSAPHSPASLLKPRSPVQVLKSIIDEYQSDAAGEGGGGAASSS